jgi:hypothetical protein
MSALRSTNNGAGCAATPLAPGMAALKFEEAI